MGAVSVLVGSRWGAVIAALLLLGGRALAAMHGASSGAASAALAPDGLGLRVAIMHTRHARPILLLELTVQISGAVENLLRRIRDNLRGATDVLGDVA
eukprot:203998_1